VGNSRGQLPFGNMGMGPVVGPPAFISVPPSGCGAGVGVLGAGGGVLGAGDGVLGAGDGDFDAGGGIGEGLGLGVVEPPLLSPGPSPGVDPQSSTVNSYSAGPNVCISRVKVPGPARKFSSKGPSVLIDAPGAAGVPPSSRGVTLKIGSDSSSMLLVVCLSFG
jgi:hypothetical protein